MAYSYDTQNIFARILRGEIPNDTVLETDHTHVLVIPKGAYVCFDDFAQNATDAEIVDFHRVAALVCQTLAICPTDGGAGYRTISNAGNDGVQEVPHYHMHILGGRPLGRMLARD